MVRLKEIWVSIWVSLDEPVFCLAKKMRAKNILVKTVGYFRRGDFDSAVSV